MCHVSRERNYLYEYKLPGQDKPRLEKAVNVDFVPFIRGVRGLRKPRPELAAAYFLSYKRPYCFPSCAVFAFLRYFYGSLYYSVVALSDIPGKTSGLSAVECLVYDTLKAHYIFLLIVILLSSLSVAQVNVPGVCFLAILRRHTNYWF